MSAIIREERIGGQRLILGDCLKVMGELGRFDAVVTDPPYFKVKAEKWDNQWKNEEEFCGWLHQVLEQCSEIMHPWASLYCFASPQMEWRVQGVVRKTFVFLNSIRWVKESGWYKKQSLDDQRLYQQNWEACLFAQKSDSGPSSLGDDYDATCKSLHRKVYQPIGLYFKTAREEAGKSYRDVGTFINRDSALYLRWEEGSSLPNPEDYKKCQEMGLPLRKQYEELRKQYEELRKQYEELRRPFNVYDTRMRGDVWGYGVVNGYAGKHPCEKPTSIIEHIIGTSSKPGQSVLDPFMGSGTSCVVCQKLGRRGTGIEIDPDYFQIACERVQEAASQPDLFVAPPDTPKQETFL